MKVKKSVVYEKESWVFGMNLGEKEGGVGDKLYVVEGGGEVVKVECIGIVNRVG